MESIASFFPWLIEKSFAHQRAADFESWLVVHRQCQGAYPPQECQDFPNQLP